MRLLLDTNRYGDLVANDPKVTERLDSAMAVYLSAITLGELHFGFALGSKRERNEMRLREALTLQGVQSLGIDVETAQYYGQIATKLRLSGTPIPSNDIWIAALALQHDLTLDTRDDHFKLASGLKLVE